jgi:hypothetical protein
MAQESKRGRAGTLKHHDGCGLESFLKTSVRYAFKAKASELLLLKGVYT